MGSRCIVKSKTRVIQAQIKPSCGSLLSFGDVQGFGTIVNVFKAFGGAKVPNPNICTYTWMCFSLPDIHPTIKGYQVIANALDEHTEY